MYKILKLKLSLLISKDYSIDKLSPSQKKKFTVLQQDNAVFRSINKLTGGNNKFVGKHEFIEDLIFININRSVGLTEWQIQQKKDEYAEKYKETGKERYREYMDGRTALEYVIKNGFKYQGVLYKRFGKSSSMARNASIAFVSEKIFDKLFDITTMGIDLKKPMVLSKFEAYRGLLFSSSIVIQKTLPYIVLIDDLEKYIPDCDIKYTVEEDHEYISKITGQVVKTKKYPIISGRDNVKISCFDGMGVHEESISSKFAEVLEEDCPAVQIRAPYMKGLSIKFSYKKYFKEVLRQDYIIDINNCKHNIDDIDCIYTLSMWKGDDYFDSWDNYKEKFKEYGHEFCVSKTSRKTDKEILYTRSNFQYLQSLTKLTKEKILDLAAYSKKYIEKIISGDLLYATKFLGLTNNEGDSGEKIDSYYMEAVKINPNMLQDKTVQKSLYNLLQKTINGFKIGRLFANAHYSMVLGDLKLFMEHAARLSPVGILEAGEFYSPNYMGDYVGFRSPMVHKSEVNKMKFTTNDWLDTWCSHLDNLIMLNGYDISMPRMGGMDLDGDIVWVSNENILYDSIEDEDVSVVVDKDDKSSAERIVYNIDNLIEYERRTLSQRIGDITNKSTGLVNQTPNSKKSKMYIDDQVVFFRLAQGHEIDSIKTGTKYEIAPYYNNIKLPYFLIYRYPREKAFLNKIKRDNKIKKINGQNPDRYNVSFSKSPMNELCWNIEKWQIELLKGFQLQINNDSYKLLMNDSVIFNDKNYWQIKKIYNQFNNDYKNLIKEHKGEEDLDKYIVSLYDDYRVKVKGLKIQRDEVVNYCVLSSYVKDKEDLEKDRVKTDRATKSGKTARIHDKSTKFVWVVVPDEILKNLKMNSPINNNIIIETDSEDVQGQEYLGRYYKIISKEDLSI